MGVTTSFEVCRKQLVRSVLDPLPKFLSIRSLVILVTMLVGGTALSVHEYLESGRITRRVHAAATLPEGTTQTLECGDSGSAAACLPPEMEPASPDGVSSCDWPIEADSSTEPAPGLWIPDSGSTGS